MLIPLRVDVPTSRRPWVNYGLMGLIVIISFAGFQDRFLFDRLAGIERVSPLDRLPVPLEPEIRPEVSTKHYSLPVLAMTSSLLHGGWLHLIGNMLFLWVFGNAANYKFGHLGFPLLYLAAAMTGGLAHYAFDGCPVVGASGAINGLMGAFLVFFPRNEVKMFIFLLFFRIGRVAWISSVWVILYWLGWDVLYLVLGAKTGVAPWAHVGGFVAGFGIAVVCAATGLIKPTEDEQTLLQVLASRR